MFLEISAENKKKSQKGSIARNFDDLHRNNRFI